MCAAFARGNEKTRAQLLKNPELVLRASDPSTRRPDDPAQQLEQDLGAMGGIARRALARVQGGAVQQLLPPEQARLRRTASGAQHEVEHLVSAIEKEIPNAE